MFNKFVTVVALAAGLAAAAPVSNSKAMLKSDGVVLCNKGTMQQELCQYTNQANGNGWAVPNFDTPDACYTLASGDCKWVDLPAGFKGRFQRGKISVPATWMELQTHAANDGAAHGDISIQQGCDGPATIESPDGLVGGFTNYIVDNAPAGATTVRSDGVKVLNSIVGYWASAANAIAETYAAGLIDPSSTYVKNAPDGVKDIASKTNAFILSVY